MIFSKRSLKDKLATMFETVWTVGFRAVGFLRPKFPMPLDFPGNQRLLVIAPHPDDEVIGCGGTILRHAMQGDDVHIAYVTDGSASRAGGLSSGEMRQTRYREAMTTAAILNATPHWFAIPETNFAPTAAVNQLAILLADLQPTIVYAPSCVDFHPLHIQVALATATAISTTALQPVVRVYPIQVPLTSVLENRMVPLHGVVVSEKPLRTQLEQAHNAYVSQQLSLGSMWRQRIYAAARYREQGLVEVFWQMDAARYIALHQNPARLNLRSLRFRPWFDPLGYAIGRLQRHTLTQSARHPSVR